MSEGDAQHDTLKSPAADISDEDEGDKCGTLKKKSINQVIIRSKNRPLSAASMPITAAIRVLAAAAMTPA